MPDGAIERDVVCGCNARIEDELWTRNGTGLDTGHYEGQLAAPAAAVQYLRPRKAAATTAIDWVLDLVVIFGERMASGVRTICKRVGVLELLSHCKAKLGYKTAPSTSDRPGFFLSMNEGDAP